MTPDDPNMAMLRGEVRGQLREVIHTVNGVSAKVDSLGREMGALVGVAADVGDLKRRVGQLEARDSERRGAAHIADTVIRSPVVGWIAAAALAIGGMLGWERAASPPPPPAARVPLPPPMAGTP